MGTNQTLRSCFAEAERARSVVESAFDSRAESFQHNVITAISKYEQCLKIVDDVSLFSPNESLEDVSSLELPFFLVHYHIAELVMRANHGGRKAVLLRARREFELYLDLLDNYDALSKDDFKTYERYRENRDSFSVIQSADAATRRQLKISKFKEEKALKAKVEHLEKNPTIHENDDSTLRELHLTRMAFYTHQTFQALDSIAQELQVLALAPPSEEPSQPHSDQDSRTSGNQTSKDEYSERVDAPLASLLANGKGGPILSKSGRPMRPFTLLDSRQRLQQGVFRPDHNLPTMTIDEYLEEERRRGGIIEGGGPQSGIREQVNEDDIERADDETMKARLWDDFKEQNPRGSGNTMNMG